jgi:Arm DNA-binding domain
MYPQMPLNDLKIKRSKPSVKAYHLSDGKGLFLIIYPNGSKYWRLKYRFAGKEKLLAIGVYPEISLSTARDKCNQARKLLDDNIDPGFAKRSAKYAAILNSENTFEAIAREWHLKYSVTWTEGHAQRIMTRLEKDIFPWIGKRPITEITAQEILGALRRVEKRGAVDAAHRELQNCGQIFRYAIATGRAERNVAGDLRGALQPTIKKHWATITEPKEIAKLMKAIDNYKGFFVTRCACA